MRKFTKYPSNYVKASTEDTHRTEYALEVYAYDDSSRGDHFVQQLDVFDTPEEAYDSAKQSPLDDSNEFYVIRYIEYERTSDGDWEEVETGRYDEITASTSIKADSEFDADYDQSIEDFMVALEKLPEIRKNPYQTPIHITNTEATIIANPDFEDIDAYIAKVERLGTKFGVLKPDTGYYDNQTHTIRFELSKPLNY